MSEQRMLSGFDMQGQAIKDVVLKEVTIEDIGQTLPSASDYPNRVLMYNGEIVYSNGEKWINSTELVNTGMSIKDSTVEGIPNGKVEINGTLYTIYTLPTIDNDLMANMPSLTIKANISDTEGSPKDVPLSDFATKMLNVGLAVKVEENGGNYVITQGYDDNGSPIEIAKLRIDRVVDEGKSVKGFWDEKREVFKENENGTDTALRLTIKDASGEVEPTYIYLDTTDLFPIFEGDDTLSSTIEVQVKDDTEKGIKRIVAILKENSVEERHLSASLRNSLDNLISSAQIQADWNQIDATQKDFIKNKPTHLPSPNDSITTEQLKEGTVTNNKLANKTINFNGQTFELGAENQDLAPLKNTGFELVTALPTTNNFEGRQVVYQGRTYTYHNGEWQSIADDLGGREETREEQFTFQPTANDESVKDGIAIVKSIKGNTVIANQICRSFPLSTNGVDVSIRDNGIVDIVCNNTSNFSKIFATYNCIKDHKYLRNITSSIYRAGLNNSPFLSFYQGEMRGLITSPIKDIYTAKQDSLESIIISSYFGLEGQLLNFTAEVNIQIIDLTQMFDAGNEPTTVEEFERLYPNLPKIYNTGSLLNLNADSIKSVGFNAFNGEYAQVLGGMQYYLGGNITSLAFKENLEDEGEVIEIPSDNLYTPNTNGYIVATGTDICINLSHSGYRNGEYEPYKESITKLPITEYFTDGMKSVGSVRDEIVWNGEKYKAIQRIDTRPYQTGDEDLADVKTDKTNTYYILETPKETIIDDYDFIGYEVSDFGTEEIIADNPTTPIVADIQYGFNAVDEIRNHRFEINNLQAKTNALHSEIKNVENSIPTELPPIDDSVSTDKIQNGAILEKKIADSAVTTNKIYDEAVTTAKIQDGAITNVKIASNAIESDHIANGAVDTEKIQDNAITEAKIKDNAISTSKIQDKAIIGDKIGQEEIGTIHIANQAITNEKLDKSYVIINGTPINLGGLGKVNGFVNANGHQCFITIENNELILSAPTFAENGSIWDFEEIVRYPLYPELPTIGNGTITLQDGLGTTLGSFGLNDTANKTISIRGVRQYVSDKLIGTEGTIKVGEHKCGTAPKVQAWIKGELTLMKVVNNGSGDLTWYSGVILTEESCCRLIIEGNPDTNVNITI